MNEFWKEAEFSLLQGNDVSAYFLHEGASALLDPRVPNLVSRGLRIFACPRAAERFAPKHSTSAVLGGPGLLAELLERSSICRSFNSS